MARMLAEDFAQPINDVSIDVIVARGRNLVDVLAHKAPIAAPRCDTPAAPEVELAVDDGITRRGEDDARILPPLRVMEPLGPYIPGAIFHHDAAIQI